MSRCHTQTKGTPTTDSSTSPLAWCASQRDFRGACHSLSPSLQFPNLKSVANTGALPLGVILQPCAPPDTCFSGDSISRAPPPRLRREPQRCLVCGAFANRYCDVDTHNGRWICVFCHASSFCRLYVGAAVRVEVAELSHSVVDYALKRPLRGESPYHTEHLALTLPPLCCAFVLDATLDGSQVGEAAKAILSAVDALPADARLCLVTFASCVAVHDLGATAGDDVLAAPAETIALHALATARERRVTLRAARARGASFVAPAAQSRAGLERALAALRPWPDVSAVDKQPRPSGARPRCVGPAVATALQLVRNATSTGDNGDDDGVSQQRHDEDVCSWEEVAVVGRVVLLTTGPPNIGPGSPSHDTGGPSTFAELGAAARQAGVVVDLLSCGAAPCDVPRLMPMVHTSGGTVMLCTDGFGTSGAGVGALLPRSLAGGATFTADPPAAAAGVDIRCSQGVEVQRIIGAIAPLPKGAEIAPQAMPNSGGPSYPDTPSVVALYPPPQHSPCQAVAYLLRLQEDTPARHVLVQFAIRNVRATSASHAADDGGGPGEQECADTVRVITRRLRCTADGEVYVNSINPEVAALLALKAESADACRAMSSGGTGDGMPFAVVSDLSVPVTSYAPLTGSANVDEAQCVRRLTHMASRHGSRTQVAATSAAAAQRQRRASTVHAWALPAPLIEFSRHLYHAWRGPLAAGASPAACEGATACVAALVHAPLLHGARTVRPRLYRVQLPAGDAQLRSAVAYAASVAGPAPGDDSRCMPPPGRVLSALTSTWTCVAEEDAMSPDGHDSTLAAAPASLPALLAEVPLVDMALRSADVMLLDSGSELVAWLGAASQAPGTPRAALVEQLLPALCASLSAWRLPPPAVRVTRQGGSQARRVTARLEPLHKDSPADRIATWPELATWQAPVDEAAAAASAAMMLPTDMLSFQQWLRSHGVAPAPGGAGAAPAPAGLGHVMSSVTLRGARDAVPLLAPATPMRV